MSLHNLLSDGERISYVDLREEFSHSSDPAKHELKFVDLTGDVQKKEILCMNNDELLKGQIGTGVFSCEYCDYKCRRTQDLKRHIPIHFQIIGEDIKNYGGEESAEEEKMHVCEECGVIFVFSKTQSNQIQIQIYKDDSEENCEECNTRLVKVGDISKKFNKSSKKKNQEFSISNAQDQLQEQPMEQHNGDQEHQEDLINDLDNDSGFLENVIIKQERKKDVKQENAVKVKKEKHDSALSNGTKDSWKMKTSKKSYSKKSDAKYRPFACPHCTFRAVEESTLQKHIKSHFIERNYACPQCSYKGPTVVALRNHLKTHSDVKPHACEQCEYRTNTIANLRRHERQHTGEKPYPCNKCVYRAAQKIALQNHMKSRHS